ncbi:hypothetical protein ACF08N_36460 [Streptomyces sp. NPDC015127]|uniref:hypothetical protein n=1 Tax=Streptomyces sp. NPDC015127 TaxID=3364939 RepID=UPI0036FED7DC
MISYAKNNPLVAALLSLVAALSLFGLSGNAGASEQSQQVVTAMGGMNSAQNKWVTAECPAGKSIYSSGGKITWGQDFHVPHNVHIVSIAPSLKADGKTGTVEVHAAEDQDGISADWAIKAYIVCG